MPALFGQAITSCSASRLSLVGAAHGKPFRSRFVTPSGGRSVRPDRQCTREKALARSTRGYLLADRDQSIAPILKRMTRIYDLHFVGAFHIIITVEGLLIVVRLLTTIRRLSG